MVPISEITVGDRRREELGAIEALARSIKKHTLYHPIIITDDGRLVFGQRRLEAYRRLGRSEIPARRFGNVSPEELREMELDENVQRTDLTPHELSAKRMRIIEAAEREAEKQPEEEFRSDSDRKSIGRPRKKGSDRDISRRTGMSKTTVHETRKHVSAAKKYPFLQHDTWPRREAILATKVLDKMGTRASAALSQMCEGLDYQTAQPLIHNVAEMEPSQRRVVVKLHASKDPDQQQRAKQVAMAARPEPDPAAGYAKRIQSYAQTVKERTKLPDVIPLLGTIEQACKEMLALASAAASEAKADYEERFELDGLQGRGR
jgi:ParB-like chromosome segregation protein Spo0J